MLFILTPYCLVILSTVADCLYYKYACFPLIKVLGSYLPFVIRISSVVIRNIQKNSAVCNCYTVIAKRYKIAYKVAALLCHSFQDSRLGSSKTHK